MYGCGSGVVGSNLGNEAVKTERIIAFTMQIRNFNPIDC
jgi:hypothetical protein